MPENNQASDATKPEATDSSSTQPGSQAVDMNHTNAIVPHQISNHDKLVQTMVMVDGEWVNVNDTNDQKNVQEDMHKVNRVVTEAQKDIINAQNAADSAVKSADSAISASKVNSDAIAAQGEAISEAKIALDSAAAEIQLTASNAASDAAKIRADVARVQNEVDTAKAANSASVEALKSDIGTTKQDLANVHDSLTKAQSAVEQNQKLINDSVAKISNDITQDRKDLATAQQNNADLAKQLDDYSKQAEAQGKTIKSIQDKQDSFTATLADVQGNVSQVSDKVDGLSASLKDAQGNVATVKAQADQLNATLTDHAKSIATLTASAKELSSTLEDADGRLNKVEQTAQTNSSTLSDVQGDLSQVKQQADGLVSTLKDAQGNIDQLQQAAKGTAEQISDVQGDITNLQKDVNGIKLTIADHDKNIHTLQADSKSLQDDMADAKGNISSLQKTSTDLTSEVQDHSGRLSKVEQTASTLTNELSDEQGHLNRVEQTAQGTQQTVANQQGQINTIKTDAAGIHETLTGQGNQIANINVTLNGLSSKYEGVSGDLGKLKSSTMQNRGTVNAPDFNTLTQAGYYTVTNPISGKNYPIGNWGTLEVSGQTVDGNGRLNQKYVGDNDSGTYTRQYNANTKSWTAWIKTANQNDVTALSNRITTNSTQITQNQQAIALKADQATVNNLSGEVSQTQAQLKVQAGQISSKVTSTDVNNIVDNKGYATTSSVQSLITQKAGTINESITNLTSEMNTRNGVNLLKGTKDFSGNWKNAGDTKRWYTENWEDPNGNASLRSYKMSWYGYYQPIQLDKGEYTFSCYYYSQGNAKIYAYIVPGDGNAAGTSANGIALDSTPNEWHLCVVHFTVTKAGDTAVRLENSQDQVLHIASYKLEKGTIANPVWTPAPSDNATVTQVQEITASIDGIQSTVANKADKSQITQLSNVIQSKVSTSDFTSKVSQLSNDINARVTKGDLLSQINLQAGNTLIQSGKIYLDAKSVVFGKDSKAFIPAALITNLTADQITTGTLKSIQIDNGDGKFTVNSNGDVVANSIKLRNGQFLQGTIAGSTIYALNNDGVQDPKLAPKSDWYKITPNMICWFNHYDQSVGQIGVGQGVITEGTSEFTGTPGLTISDSAKILLGTAQRTVVTGDEIGNLEKTGLDWMSRTNLEIKVDGLQVNLDPDQGNEYDGKGAEFAIQKDDKIGAYFGRGDHGNVIYLVTAGDGGNVDVQSSLTVHGAKNAVVPTTQGTVAINAYETAEYYFGDIGEDQTNVDGKVWVSIDYLFGQTVNTSVPYQVFVTPYSSAHVWVSKRLKNRFLVESDKPNASFAWEIKAKRKGYEHTRLKNVDNMMEKPAGVK